MFVLLLVTVFFFFIIDLSTGQYIPLQNCFQTPAQCIGLQNPCSLSPTCPLAPQAICYPNYCLGSCGVTQYYLTSPINNPYANPIQGCPTMAATTNPAIAGVYQQPQSSIAGVYQPQQTYPPVNGMYPGIYPNSYQMPGYPAGGSPLKCPALIADILGPSTGGSVILTKRETPDELIARSRVRRQIFERYRNPTDKPTVYIYNPFALFTTTAAAIGEATTTTAAAETATTAAAATTTPGTQNSTTTQSLSCNNEGCWVIQKDTTPQGSGKEGLLRANWHQQHRLVFLRSCDQQLYTTQCQFGQQCCQIYQVFNKFYCVGKPVDPYSMYQSAQMAPTFVSRSSPTPLITYNRLVVFITATSNFLLATTTFY